MWNDQCRAVNRADSNAVFYTFNVLEDSQVTIDLTSNDQDSYLYLLNGA